MSPVTGLVPIVMELLHIKQTDLTSRAKEKIAKEDFVLFSLTTLTTASAVKQAYINC